MAEDNSRDLDYDYREESTTIKVDMFLIEYIVTIFFTVDFTAVLAATVIFVYAFYRFKKLRTRPNFILLNFFLTVCVYTFSIVLSLYLNCFEIMSKNRFAFNTLNELSTFFLSAVLYFFVSSIFFMLLLGVDWFLSVNYPQFGLKYHNYDRWVIAGVYLLCSVNGLFLFLPKTIAVLLLFVDIFLIIVSMLSIVALACLNKFKSYSEEALKSFYRFSFALTYVVLWFFICLSIVLSQFLWEYLMAFKMMLILFKFFLLCSILIAILAPVAVLVGLMRRDAHFKSCVDYLCKKSSGLHEELQEEHFDEII